jgi:hypothetical protein
MGVLGFEIAILFVCLILQKSGMNLMQLEETPVPYLLTDYNPVPYILTDYNQ